MITSEQGNAWMKLQSGWYYNNSVGNLVLSRSSQNSIICLLFDKSINEQSSSSFLPDSSLQPCSAHPYLPLHLFPFVLPLLLYSFPFLSSSDTPPSCLLTPHFGDPGVASALWHYYLCPFAQPEFTYWVPTSGGIEEWCIETVEIQDLMVQRRVSVNMDGTNNKKTQTEPTEDTFVLPFKP